MRLGQFSFGYIVSVGIAATVFFFLVKYGHRKFPKAPVLGPIARTVGG